MHQITGMVTLGLAVALLIATGVHPSILHAYPTDCEELGGLYWKQRTLNEYYKEQYDALNNLRQSLIDDKSVLECTKLDELGLSREEYDDRLAKCKIMASELDIIRYMMDDLEHLRDKSLGDQVTASNLMFEHHCDKGDRPGVTLGGVSLALCPRSVIVRKQTLMLRPSESGTENPVRLDPSTSGHFRCQYSAHPKPAKTRIILGYLREPGWGRYCQVPRDHHGYLNSTTHEIQVFVPPIIDQADDTRRDLLRSLEEANIGWPCETYD